MQLTDVIEERSIAGANPWTIRSGKEAAQLSEQLGISSHVDFHHASNHLSQREAGYYLILLRRELHHRSLKKNAWMDIEE